MVKKPLHYIQVSFEAWTGSMLRLDYGCLVLLCFMHVSTRLMFFYWDLLARDGHPQACVTQLEFSLLTCLTLMLEILVLIKHYVVGCSLVAPL